MTEDAVRLVPVRMTKTAPATAESFESTVTHDITRAIEISLPDGSRVRVGEDVSLKALRRVMTVLRDWPT